MKERYESPFMDIINFEVEDIITKSGENELPFEPIGNGEYRD